MVNSMVYSTIPNQRKPSSPLQLNISSKKVNIPPVQKPSGVRPARASLIGIRQQQKPIQQDAYKNSMPRQQKLMRQVLAVQPAIPQQQLEATTQEGTRNQAPSLNNNNTKSSTHQNLVPRHGSLQKSKEQQIQPQLPVIPSQLQNIPNFSYLLHQLATVVRRRQATASIKKPMIQTSNSKCLGKRSRPSMGCQRSELLEKGSKIQLPQAKFIGKVRKITSPNVQQRQFMEQTKKYITNAHPEDLKFIKKSVTPKPSKALIVQQQTLAPVILKQHQFHNVIKNPPSNYSITNLESENELRCAICTEIFIEAMTLSCSHTYCKYCITQWRKNRPSCPICNIKISKEYPTSVIDNYIEKILEKASKEVKDHRRQIIEQRLAATVSSNKKKRMVEFPIGTGTAKRIFA